MESVRSVGIVGHGHFGTFLVTLCERFLPHVEIRVYSRRATPDGERFFSLADTAGSDVVILAGSIADYEAQLTTLLPHLGPKTVVVDVATVKIHTSRVFASLLGKQPYFCCHPMFGAESYKKTEGDVTGYRIVVTDTNLDAEVSSVVTEALRSLGFTVLEMSSEEHDRLLADTLFITHYIGQTMSAGSFGRTEIDTVSFQSLMNAVESVAQDSNLFRDVYRFNPYCKEAATRFHDAQKRVFDALP